MLTTLLIAATVGVLVGGWLGYKVGRTAERVRPSKKKDEREEERARRVRLLER